MRGVKLGYDCPVDRPDRVGPTHLARYGIARMARGGPIREAQYSTSQWPVPPLLCTTYCASTKPTIWDKHIQRM